MKNAFLTIAIMTLVATAVTGCDFFRRLAGRPDSEWIEAKAEAIRQEEEALRIRQDSLERARKAEADSLAAADSVRLANHRYRFCRDSGLVLQQRECRAVCRGDSGEGV